MKTLKTLVMAAALLTIAVIETQPARGAEYVASQGLYVDGSTSTINCGGGTTNVGYLLAASTNSFNLSNTIQGQANTNIWPAMPITPRGSSARNLGLVWSYKGVDANATNDYVWRFAVSADGSTWKSNFFAVSSKGLGTATVVVATNMDTFAFPFVCLQSEEAPTVSGCTSITNIAFSAARKPGI